MKPGEVHGGFHFNRDVYVNAHLRRELLNDFVDYGGEIDSALDWVQFENHFFAVLPYPASNPESPIRHSIGGFPKPSRLFLIFGNVLDQFLDPTIEIGTDPIQMLSPGAPTRLIENPRQRGSCDSGFFGNFVDGDPPPLLELLFRDELL